MRNILSASGCKPLMRLSVVALIGGTAAACSSDSARFSSAGAPAGQGGPAYTGSLAAAPTGAVQSAPMTAPGGPAVASGYPAPAYGAPAPYGAAPAPYSQQQLASATPANAAPQYPAQAYPNPAYPNPGYPNAAAPAPQYPNAQYQTPQYPAPAVAQQQPLYGTQPQQLAAPAVAPVRAPQVAAATTGAHVVQPGETLSSISRNYGISRSALAAANGVDFNAQVQIGRKLVVPGAGAAGNPVAAAPKPATHEVASAAPVTGSKPAPLAAPTPHVAAAPAAQKPAVVAAAPAPAPVQPAVEKPQTIAAVKPAETPDDARTASGAQFRWPVRGRVISGFGPKPGGQKNEGINVSVPEGTSVKAAEDGVVAYAGSELKGYGNLVLIKHADGYVTAYAHNSELDVKKGDAVKRGQVIAKAGQTGNVNSPQVHFEIRKGSEPVDPSQYLAGL